MCIRDSKEAGLFKKHGLDVSIKKIPQKDRHLAIASGDVQCAATTVETWIGWNAAGVATTQIFQLDKSFGADGMVVKPAISKITDLKGKTVAVSYTHLDVYKRQGQVRSSRVSPPPFFHGCGATSCRHIVCSVTV